jgi:predicted Zn-dependent peptidase
MPFHHTVLDNALEIVAESHAEQHSAALAFFVKTGARDEPPELSGVSHFLEHMAFKGTATRSSEEVNRALDALGAESNAFTSKEATVYWVSLLPECIEPALELLADILRPALREEDFATEKQVILEEIRMYQDQPPYGADELCEALHFGAHPLGRNILGTAATVEALTIDALRQYHHRRYGAANIVLVATGRIDFDSLVRLAQRYCGRWEPGECPSRRTPARRACGFRWVQRAASAQQYAVMISAAPAAHDPLRHAADVLATILGDSTGSRFYWALVDPGIAEHASLSFADYQEAGIFWSSLSCLPEELDRCLHVVHDVLQQVQREGVGAAELRRAKNKTAARIVLANETSRRRLFAVGGEWVQRGQYVTVRQEIDAVQSVTLEEIRSVLDQYPLLQTATVTIGPRQDITPPW